MKWVGVCQRLCVEGRGGGGGGLGATSPHKPASEILFIPLPAVSSHVPLLVILSSSAFWFFSTCGAAPQPFFLFPFLLLPQLSCCTWNDFAWHVRRLLVRPPADWLWCLRHSLACLWGRGDSCHVFWCQPITYCRCRAQKYSTLVYNLSKEMRSTAVNIFNYYKGGASSCSNGSANSCTSFLFPPHSIQSCILCPCLVSHAVDRKTQKQKCTHLSLRKTFQRQRRLEFLPFFFL